MSFIVERRNEDGRHGYTGPMRTLTHAQRERDAWLEAGWEACTLEYTAEVKQRVREWEKAKR